MGDADLLARSETDPEAFGTLFDRHGDAVFGFFARRVPRQEVPDLVAETFRLAFDLRTRFEVDRGPVRSWLYGLATNVLRHHLRSGRREGAALARLAPDGRDDDGEALRVESALDAAGTWPAVASALATLVDHDRETLLLHAWEGLSYAEVALATGVPVGTVRSRINRARRQIRGLVGDDHRPARRPTPTEEATDRG